MGFDAGKITAHMELETDGFNASADDVEEKKDSLKEPVETSVDLDSDEFDAKVDEVKAEKEALAEPIDIDVNLNGEEAVAEAEATREEIKTALDEHPVVTPELDSAPIVAEAEATGYAVKKALANPFTAGSFPQSSMIELLLGSNTEEQAAQALKSLNGGAIADARQMISDFTDFQIAEAMRARAGVLSAASGWSMPGVGGGAHGGIPLPAIPQMAATLLGDQAALTMGGADGGALDLFDGGNAARFAKQWEQAVLNGPQANWDYGGQEFPALNSGDTFGNWISNMARDASGNQAALGRGTLPWGDGTAGVEQSWIDAEVLRNDPFSYGGGTSGPDPIWKQMGLSPLQAEGFHAIKDSGGGNFESLLADQGFNLDGTPVTATEDVQSAAEKFAANWKADASKAVQDAQTSIFDGVSGGSAWGKIFSGKSGIADDIAKAAKKMGVDVGKDFTDALSKSILDEAKASTSLGGGGGGFIDKILGGVSGAAQSIVGGAGSALSSVSGLSGGATAGIVAAPLIVPILGAVGLATGGAVAGTAIGTAGLLTALVPGLLDLYKGYTAYSDAKSGTADPGATAGNVSVGSAIGNIIGSGTSFLGKAETEVNPDILKFLDAVPAALSAMQPFAQAAIGSLSRFFDVIDKGMQSAGFKSFMATMSRDVGPIMDDFGKFTEHMGTAFGGFLKLFGGAPAQAVGAWFDRVSGGLSSFLNQAQISPGFMAGMTQAFNFLGAAGDLVWHALTKVFEALAPIGLTMMKVLTPALQGLTSILDAIPVNVLTALAVGFGALVIATSPLLLLAAAVLAVGAAVGELNKVGSVNYAPMTAKQIDQAFAGDLTPANKRTPAELSAIAQANLRGLTPQQVGAAYTYQAPARVADSGYSSPEDTVRFTPFGVQAPRSAAQTKATKPLPDGVFSAQNIARTWNDAKHAYDAFVNDLNGLNVNGKLKDFGNEIKFNAVNAWQGLDNNFVHPIAHFFDSMLPDFFTEGAKYIGGWAGDVGHWAVVGWQKFDANFIHPIAHFFDSTLPDFFTEGGKDIGHWAGDIGHWAIVAWQTFDNGFVHPIANFFDTTLPAAIDKIVNWFSTLPGRIKSAIGSGLTVLTGWGKDLVDGIANGIRGAAGEVGAALKSIANSIPGFSQMKSFLGGLPGMGFLQGWAAGGPYLGGPMIVGENGPEIMVPTGGGYVIPNNRLGNYTGGRSSGMSIVVNVDARGSANPSATSAAASQGIMAVVPQLRRALQRAA